jgi:hypothetical protein
MNESLKVTRREDGTVKIKMKANAVMPPHTVTPSSISTSITFHTIYGDVGVTLPGNWSIGSEAGKTLILRAY